MILRHLRECTYLLDGVADVDRDLRGAEVLQAGGLAIIHPGEGLGSTRLPAGGRDGRSNLVTAVSMWEDSAVQRDIRKQPRKRRGRQQER